MIKVLLVDDEPIFLEFMRKVLDWEIYDCRIIGCAEDGERALTMVREDLPDIVFIDINMPRMTGLDVCRIVREEKIATQLIIVTAHDEFAFAYQAIKLGIDDFLLKPFTREELESSLTKALEGLVSSESSGATSSTENEVSTTKMEIIASSIDDYLISHYANPELTLQVLSHDLSFENSYLRRVYKLVRGITISQKLETLRIDEAKRLLRTGRYQGQEISQMVGFSDPFYFSKRFKQVVGKTPTEYRTSHE